MTIQTLETSKVAPRSEWRKQRLALLEKEKELTKLQDQVAAERQRLPWVELDQDYSLSGPDGLTKLSSIFGDASQLIVYHFMFGPDWDEGCKSCSFVADHFDSTLSHLNARDTKLVCISRAPHEKLQSFKDRMGWKFPWYSSADSSFNFDFSVSFKSVDLSSSNEEYNFARRQIPIDELQGFSVFVKPDNGKIYHTYSSYARGVETAMTTYSLLDILPSGRNEDDLEYTMEWVKYHDQYEQ